MDGPPLAGAGVSAADLSRLPGASTHPSRRGGAGGRGSGTDGTRARRWRSRSSIACSTPSRSRWRRAGGCCPTARPRWRPARRCPRVSAEMVDWWFDWHPREAIRYRIWHPPAHFDNSLQAPPEPGAKPHWGAVHHPVEDVGVGVVHARICFQDPSLLGMIPAALAAPQVGTVLAAEVGDDRRHVRHSLMFHVFLRERRRARSAQPLLARCGDPSLRSRRRPARGPPEPPLGAPTDASAARSGGAGASLRGGVREPRGAAPRAVRALRRPSRSVEPKIGSSEGDGVLASGLHRGGILG